MALKTTMEIFGTRMWDMAPDYLHYHKQIVDSNILLRAQFDKDESGMGEPYFASMADGFSEKLFVGKATSVRWWDEMGWENGDTIVSVLPVCGPIIRNGDGCSYGSKNYRDFMMAAADVPGCVGHLIYIDTPGGSAYAKNDFQYAIDYAKSKGQPVIALVDGLCASAGMALAAMCDEIYFMNPSDRIGSIGTMCAFYAIADGVQNAISKETYVEVYGSKSEYKNKEYRDAAAGNYDELQAEVDDLNEQFWSLIKTYRPQVQEEQMHGKVYNCGDVIGTLVDGQGTMQSCIERILALSGEQTGVAAEENNGEATPSAPENTAMNSVDMELPSEDFTGEDPKSDDVAVSPQEETTQELIQNTNNPETETTNEPVVPLSSEEVPAFKNEEKNMKEYPLIMSALGINALAVDKENGYYMNEALCDAMEAFVAQAKQDKLTMDAKIQEVAQLNAKIEELKGEHEQAINGLNEAHNQEIEKLNGEHAEAVQTLTEQKDGEIANLNGQLNAANETISGLKGQIEANEAEIKELAEATVEPQLPEAPASNGMQVAETEQVYSAKAVNGKMSDDEKKQALIGRMQFLKSRFK